MHLIVLVGPAGAGKSTLAKKYEDSGYVRISQDDMGKIEHLMHYQNALCEKKDIVLDRMNFNKEQRARYITSAKVRGYSIKIVVLHVPYDECLKRCLKRQGHPTITEEKHAKSALNTFFGKYERPTLEECDELEILGWETDKSKQAICFDIDGTAANIDHRLHHVDKSKGKTNWKAFFDDMDKDIPNKWCQELFSAFTRYGQKDIVFASGRSDDYRKFTQGWLDKFYTSYKEYPLFMRLRNDYRKDTIVKQNILDFELRTRYNDIIFVDDRPSVCRMWRENGYVVLQVNDKEF